MRDPKSIDAASLAEGLKAGRLRLIDIREPHEHARERIDGALLFPLSQAASANLALDAGATAVFHCKSGMRTAMNGAMLAAKVEGRALILDGGIEAWKRAGLPVARPGGPSFLARLFAIFSGKPKA